MQQGFIPDWLSFEVERALAAISAPNVASKEITVLRMAQAIAQGEPQSEVWAAPGTCSKNTWHGVNGRVGWKDDPAIKTALTVATDRARWWVRVKQGRAVERSLEVLIDASESAARQLANMVTMGVLIFDFGADGMELRRAETGHVLEASKQILDRVSALTAAKSTQVQALDADQFAELQREARARALTVANEAGAAWDPDSEPDPDA